MLTQMAFNPGQTVSPSKTVSHHLGPLYTCPCPNMDLPEGQVICDNYLFKDTFYMPWMIRRATDLPKYPESMFLKSSFKSSLSWTDDISWASYVTYPKNFTLCVDIRYPKHDNSPSKMMIWKRKSLPKYKCSQV